MKVLKKSSVAFTMIMVLILNIMSVSASELPKEAVYDLKKGGTQIFILQDEEGKVTEVVIEEVNTNARIANGNYKVSYKNPGIWEAGFYVEISANKIASAYSPFHSVATGMILYPNLARNSETKVTYSFLYKQAASNYSTGVIAEMSGTDLVVRQK